jgi:hypothetical protein
MVRLTSRAADDDDDDEEEEEEKEEEEHEEEDEEEEDEEEEDADDACVWPSHQLAVLPHFELRLAGTTRESLWCRSDSHLRLGPPGVPGGHGPSGVVHSSDRDMYRSG